MPSLLSEPLFSTLCVHLGIMPGAFDFLSSGVPPFTSFLKPLLGLASHFVCMAVTAPKGPLASSLCTQLLEAFLKLVSLLKPLKTASGFQQL